MKRSLLTLAPILAVCFMAACQKKATDKAGKGEPVVVERHLEETKGGPMVYVPAGEFMMGCNDGADNRCDDDEKPCHKVYVDEFYIDKYEVTVEQYRTCVQSGKCDDAGLRKYNKCNYDKSGRGDHPINCVDWYQARAYCEFAGKRLPTEAEWEKAARGADGRFFPWGNNWNPRDANYCDSSCGGSWADKNHDDGYPTTAPVGSFPDGASPYGTMDMAGNVSEWCSDRYDENYYSAGPSRNPTGPASGDLRVVRGGAWNHIPYYLRTSHRTKAFPSFSLSTVGFRCARD